MWAIKKNGMPKMNDPKKMDTSMSMKKIYNNNKIYIYIAMSSCYPNKGEREIHKRSIAFHHPPPRYVHNHDQLV